MPEPEESVARRLPISLHKFCDIVGISRSTAWRWQNSGLLQTFLIYNKRYVRAEVVEDFVRRAERGDLARPTFKPTPHSRRNQNGAQN